MNLLIPIITTGIIIIIGIFNHGSPSNQARKVLHASTSVTETPAETATPTHTSQVTVSIKSETTFPSPTPTSLPAPQSNSGDFIYPGASVSTNSGGSVNLTSSDDPDAITNWYKDKIKGQGMNVTSFVVTKTNDNVNNVLAGAGNSKNVKVTIQKNSGDSLTKIMVENP